MPKISHISFNILTTTREGRFDDGDSRLTGPHTVVDVEVLFDGEVVRAGELFDGLTVLIQGTQEGPMDPFTCGCGVAGCAGIHESVMLRVDEATQRVYWLFPEEYFRGVFKAPRWPADKPLQVVFDLAQYTQALAKLEEDVAAFFTAEPQRVLVAPDWACERQGATSFAELMVKAREWREDYLEGYFARVEAEGTLPQWAVQATLPDGIVLVSGLDSIVWELVQHIDEWEDRVEAVQASAGPALLANPVSAAKALTQEQRSQLFLVVPEAVSDEIWAETAFAVIPCPYYLPPMKVAA